MYKFVIVCAVLWNSVCEISGQTGLGTDTATPILTSINLPNKNENGDDVGLRGNHSFYAVQQIFYFGGRPNFNSIGNRIDADYQMTNGTGAHKLHFRKVSWSRARALCVEEGAHLAIIRSELEEQIVLKMMVENSLDDAWLGLHDRFEHGNWISVLDEPLGKTGWSRWSTGQPDNHGGNQHCVRIMRNGKMDDDNCDGSKPFVCKISTY